MALSFNSNHFSVRTAPKGAPSVPPMQGRPRNQRRTETVPLSSSLCAADGMLDPDADAGFLGVYKSLPSRQVAAFRLFWGWITASWG